MDQQAGFRFFRDDLCDRCGICLEQCPHMELSTEQARREIEKLINGDRDTSLVLNRCVTCNICEFVCPQAANPYGLILERHDRTGHADGLPYISKFIFPNEPENMWTNIRVLVSDEERLLMNAWEANLNNPRKEVLVTGFYNNLVPFITQTSLLDELRPAIVGSDMMFGMGEDAYRLGFFDEAASLGRQAVEKFTAMGVEKMICFMVVEASMFTDVLPNKFGIQADFEVQLLDSWLLDRMKSGQIKADKKLGMKVTVHDNCCGRYMEGILADTTRAILDMVGCDIVEMRHCKENALCCGWAGTVPTLFGSTSGNPVHTLMNLLQGLYLRLQEAEETGADALVVPCPGCYAFMSLIKVLTNSRVDVFLPMELVQLAAGETLVHKNQERAWDILAVTTNLVLKWPFSQKRFFPRPIDIEQPLPVASQRDAARIKLFGKLYHSRVVQNRVSRALIAATVKQLIGIYRLYLKKQDKKLLAAGERVSL